MACSLPGSSVHGISQAGILEWVAISFSRGSSWTLTRIEPVSPALTGGFFTTLGSPWINPVNHLIWDDGKCCGEKSQGRAAPVKLEVRGRHLSCDIWAVSLVMGRAPEVWDSLEMSPPGRGTASIKVPEWEHAWNMWGLAKKPVWLEQRVDGRPVGIERQAVKRTWDFALNVNRKPWRAFTIGGHISQGLPENWSNRI